MLDRTRTAPTNLWLIALSIAVAMVGLLEGRTLLQLRTRGEPATRRHLCSRCQLQSGPEQGLLFMGITDPERRLLAVNKLTIDVCGFQRKDVLSVPHCSPSVDDRGPPGRRCAWAELTA